MDGSVAAAVIDSVAVADAELVADVAAVRDFKLDCAAVRDVLEVVVGRLDLDTVPVRLSGVNDEEALAVRLKAADAVARLLEVVVEVELAVRLG